MPLRFFSAYLSKALHPCDDEIKQKTGLPPITGSGLLPALRGAKERARTAVCVNNLHQIEIGFMTHMADNNRVPIAAINPDSTAPRAPVTSAAAIGGRRD